MSDRQHPALLRDARDIEHFSTETQRTPFYYTHVGFCEIFFAAVHFRFYWLFVSVRNRHNLLWMMRRGLPISHSLRAKTFSGPSAQPIAMQRCE